MSPDAAFQLLACRYLRKQTKTLLAHIDGIRMGHDTEHLRKARIASRRIRTAFSVFKTVFPAKKVRRWNRHIRRLTRGLGAARDKDVQTAFIVAMVADRAAEQCSDLPGLERLLLRLRQERAAIQPRVIKTLDRFDGTGVPGEMLARTAKLKSSLRKRGPDIGNSFILKRSARDIRKTCDRLLRLQSCLEDAEAIQQHHEMRIVAKRLRYLTEIYRKPLNGQLDAAVKSVRDVQTLLGEIHDCDVWGDVIEQFMQAEQRRTVEYFGHAMYFWRLRPGIEYLRNERITHRRDTFDELLALWRNLRDRGFWEQQVANVKPSRTGARSRLFRSQATRSGEQISQTAPALEESSAARTQSSRVEMAQPLDEQASCSSSPIVSVGQEESHSDASPGGEPEAETVEPAPSSAQTTRGLRTWHPGEPVLPAETDTSRSIPDASVVSYLPSSENAICECCGLNGFPPHELFRIDSGQLLCPGCLGAFHEKAGGT